MKIKMVKKDGKKLTFILEGSSPAFANALRRIMQSEIPVLAVKWIDVHENTSILFDEMIAHRIGLIPLIADPEKFNFSEECKCGGKGCSLCQVSFIIEKRGPCTVYSGDMISSNKTVKPLSPDFPIVELLEGQSIRLEAVARLGIGKEHARHQAAIVGYQYWPEIAKTGEGADKAAKKCPKDILEVSGKKVLLKDPVKCDMCRACEPEINIKGDESKFIFRIESVSGLEPDYIVKKAAEILIGKAEEFKKLLSKA
ncbi:MAG: DNA-directed RNA polymerase subunit D [Candidatus Aenigmatarchaeota archaeon]